MIYKKKLNIKTILGWLRFYYIKMIFNNFNVFKYHHHVSSMDMKRDMYPKQQMDNLYHGNLRNNFRRSSFITRNN